MERKTHKSQLSALHFIVYTKGVYLFLFYHPHLAPLPCQHTVRLVVSKKTKKKTKKCHQQGILSAKHQQKQTMEMEMEME